MMRWLIIICTVAAVVQGGSVAYAADQPALRIQPLQHTDTLAPGERKQGYVDIANVQPQAIDVDLSVQGFRQTDDKGTLVFFDDPRLAQGIQLDLHNAQIPARKTLRLFFVADGTKLPTGDVFAAIFARVTSGVAKGSAPSVRLGSLLILTNGTPGARQADITGLRVAMLQAGSGIDGQISIKNTADPKTASGFFPDIAVQVWPFGPTTTLHSPLVYAGNTRTVSFRMDGNFFGVYKVAGTYAGHGAARWILAVTGFWRWLAPLVGVIFVTLVVWFLQRFKPHHRFARKR